MALDFGLITHPAQGYAHKPSPGRPGNGPPKRCLSNARRTNQTEDRPLYIPDEMLHCQVLDDPLLYLIQAEMIFLKDPLRPKDIFLVFRHVFPWQGEEPVDITPDYRGLGAHRRHHLKPAHFIERLFEHILRHILLTKLLIEARDLVIQGLHRHLLRIAVFIVHILLFGFNPLLDLIFQLGLDICNLKLCQKIFKNPAQA